MRHGENEVRLQALHRYIHYMNRDVDTYMDLDVDMVIDMDMDINMDMDMDTAWTPGVNIDIVL
jgi:hypothetical protein